MHVPTISQTLDVPVKITVIILVIFSITSLIVSFTKSLIRAWKDK